MLRKGEIRKIETNGQEGCRQKMGKSMIYIARQETHKHLPM